MVDITAFVRQEDPDGAKFDAISDSVDAINVAKLQAKEDAQKEEEAYAAAEFDKEKNKAAFRQFVDENESSKRFYM